MPFATYEDVESRLGRSLSPTERNTVSEILAEASSAIQIYTGQRFEAGTETITLRSRTGTVLLPQRPVKDVVEMTAYDADYLNYELSGNTITGLPVGTLVTVTYEYGYDDVPEAIQGIVVRAAVRAINNPNGLASVTVGGYSETYSSKEHEQGIVFGLADRMILDRYRLPAVRTAYLH